MINLESHISGSMCATKMSDETSFLKCDLNPLHAEHYGGVTWAG